MVQGKTEKGERGSRAKDPREGNTIPVLIRTEGGPVGIRVQYDPYRYSSPGDQALCERQEDLGDRRAEVQERGEREKIEASRKRRVQRWRSHLGVRSLIWR